MIKGNTQYNGKNFLDSRATFVANSQYDVAFRKGPVLAVLTNRGSPSQAATFGVSQTGFPDQTVIVECVPLHMYSQ